MTIGKLIATLVISISVSVSGCTIPDIHGSITTSDRGRTPMIRHTVAFTLKHTSGSESEASFLQAARVLSSLPTVRNFEWLREVSQKNKFEFGFSMEFASQQDYEAYSNHPEHVRFVETRWKPEVADFLEIDYVPFVPG